MTPTPLVILITGCSTGIGRATATRLVAAGHIVYATARRSADVDDLALLGCHTLELDVTDDASMTAAIDAILARHGRIDALVNNAGYSLTGAVESLEMPDIRRQFETNVFGAVRMTQLVLPAMRRAGRGRVVNIGSMGGVLTLPGGGAYHATKYAMEAFSDALRFEVSGFGIDVVLIQPGLIRSAFTATAVSAVPRGTGPYSTFNAAVARNTTQSYVEGPLARLGGEPDAVAEGVERALLAKSPRSRMRVTPSAHLLMGLRRILSDRLWDRFLDTRYPRPALDPETADPSGRSGTAAPSRPVDTQA